VRERKSTVAKKKHESQKEGKESFIDSLLNQKKKKKKILTPEFSVQEQVDVTQFKSNMEEVHNPYEEKQKEKSNIPLIANFFHKENNQNDMNTNVIEEEEEEEIADDSKETATFLSLFARTLIFLATIMLLGFFSLMLLRKYRTKEYCDMIDFKK
jgi:hypothetical protein